MNPTTYPLKKVSDKCECRKRYLSPCSELPNGAAYNDEDFNYDGGNDDNDQGSDNDNDNEDIDILLSLLTLEEKVTDEYCIGVLSSDPTLRVFRISEMHDGRNITYSPCENRTGKRILIIQRHGS